MSSVEWVRNWPNFKIGPLTNGPAPSKKQLRQHSLKTIGLEMLIEKINGLRMPIYDNLTNIM
jgi:hypothetical protein